MAIQLMPWDTALILMLAIIVVFVITGLPVAIVLLMPSIYLLWVGVGFERAMIMMLQQVSDFWSHWSLLTIAMFVLMGECLFRGGSAEDIFKMANAWLRRLPGGLAMVSTGACAVFASMCGSTAGATSTMAFVAIPQMLERGYSQRLACGAIAGAGALAHIIPPSVLMVVYASIVEISPGRALISAIIPGILLATYDAIVVLTWLWFRPKSAPREAGTSWREKAHSLGAAWQPIVLIMAVMGTLYLGIATATEAAAMGALAALIMAAFKTRFNWAKLKHAFVDGARITCFILLISVSGKILAMVMTYYLIPTHIVDIMKGMNLSPLMTMVFIQGLYIFLGMWIEPIGIMVVTLPIAFPIIMAMGFDPYWFGVMAMVNFEIALVTPPFGTQLYIIKGVVPQVPLPRILEGSLIFLIAPLAMLVTLYIFPELATWLPSKMWAAR